MNLAILTCNGLDKPEGSLAREVALRLAEEAGVEIICPVALNRTPARYKKALAESRLIVVDGCATQCASRLATAAAKKPAQKLVLTELLKRSGRTLGRELRLDSEALALAGRIVADLVAAETAESDKAPGSRAMAEAARETAAEAPAEAPAEAARADEPFANPSDFLLVVHDKYEFRVPRTGFFFNPNDVWAQVVGNRARVGISDYLQQRLTDITFVELPELGAGVEQFGEVGSVESVKASFEVVSPVSGTVVRVNEALLDTPEAINEDPYGSWIVELELVSWEEDRTLLLDGPAYAKEVERKAAEDR